MAARLLTQVVTRIVNNKEKAGAYGVSILNLKEMHNRFMMY